ncbi:MAG TPA: phage tail protein [Bryobacteraceae bacterium]|nr:phage tail protein [Bryobacteraceae bacterium]
MSTTTWPLAKFYFKVQMGSLYANFQEVTGLESETKVIEYRGGGSALFSPTKQKGLSSVGNVTMRKGIFANDTAFWTLYNTIYVSNTATARQTISVMLLDEAGTTQMTWTLNNAFPIKLIGTDLKSEANEVAVEALEIAYETLAVTGG